MPKKLISPRLDLLPCDLNLLKTLLAGDAAMVAALDVDIPEQWTEFGLAPIQWTHDVLAADAGHLGWLTYLGVHRADQRLISTCGYKGKPDAEGVVEIGYEVHPDYRERGLATEIATALVAHAFTDSQVREVIAHTLAEENASVAVLRKAGFVFAGEVIDPDDGPVWQWRAALRQN